MDCAPLHHGCNYAGSLLCIKLILLMNVKPLNGLQARNQLHSCQTMLPVAFGLHLLVFQHLISSYLVEVCAGCELQLHVCLFSVNAYSFDEDPPPRYASPKETATAYKEIVQAADGRFHWFGETGVLEFQGVFLTRFQLPHGNPLKWSLDFLRMWAPL